MTSTTQFAAYSWITCACLEAACRVLVLDCTRATHRTPITSVDLDGQALANGRASYSTSVTVLSRWASVPHASRRRIYHLVSWLGSSMLVIPGAAEWSSLPWEEVCYFKYRSTQHAIALVVSIVSGTLIIMSLNALKWAPDRSNIFRGTLYVTRYCFLAFSPFHVLTSTAGWKLGSMQQSNHSVHKTVRTLPTKQVCVLRVRALSYTGKGYNPDILGRWLLQHCWPNLTLRATVICSSTTWLMLVH